MLSDAGAEIRNESTLGAADSHSGVGTEEGTVVLPTWPALCATCVLLFWFVRALRIRREDDAERMKYLRCQVRQG